MVIGKPYLTLSPWLGVNPNVASLPSSPTMPEMDYWDPTGLKVVEPSP